MNRKVKMFKESGGNKMIKKIRPIANVGKQLLYAKIFRKNIPIRVGLQITKYCNLKCSYCYVNFNTYKNINEITLEEIFIFIDKLYDYGTRWIWFLGGEPLSRDDFGEIIDYVHSKGMFCDMNSNGLFVNEKSIKAIKKLDMVSFSLDGNKEITDYYRGRGVYDALLRNVEILKKHNVNVRFHSILTKKTAATLPDMVKLSNKLKAPFNYCEVLRKEREPEHILSDKESENFYKSYYMYKKQGALIANSLAAIKYMLNWPKKGGDIIYKNEASKYKNYMPCYYPELTCTLDLDGKLYSCHGSWDEGLNINEVGVEEAHKYLLDKKECISCKCIGIIELNLFLTLSMKNLLNTLVNTRRLV